MNDRYFNIWHDHLPWGCDRMETRQNPLSFSSECRRTIIVILFQLPIKKINDFKCENEGL